MKTIEAAAMRNGVADGLVLDVRTPAEYGEVHIPGAVLVPLTELDTEEVRRLSAGKPVYVVCRSGNRAKQACTKLDAAGVPELHLLEGGMQAWEAIGGPVHRGKAVMSLERQVRIAAGGLVLIGVGLGFSLNPWWFGLSAFVGAGLVFAGLTDTCGMGMMLARMPWNNRRPEPVTKPQQA